MRRVLCMLTVVCLCVPFVGCDGDSVNDAAPVSPTQAKSIADQMPGPDVKAVKKK